MTFDVDAKSIFFLFKKFGNYFKAKRQEEKLEKGGQADQKGI